MLKTNGVGARKINTKLMQKTFCWLAFQLVSRTPEKSKYKYSLKQTLKLKAETDYTERKSMVLQHRGFCAGESCHHVAADLWLLPNGPVLTSSATSDLV